ncbi:hypothetical protein NM98002_2175 [Neisseria meningitidis 98002]|nr:hypothetical protein NM98002_2175 [Neisseria meningitidis 98002]
MPTILVWINSPAEPIERSTWLSAAKCITASGRCCANTRSSSARSQMSTCSKA